MIEPTELFVLIINIVGLPLFSGVIRSAGLPGGRWFIAAYSAIFLSNIFTVVEGLQFEAFFNLLEHCMITTSSVFFFLAIREFCQGRGLSSSPFRS